MPTARWSKVPTPENRAMRWWQFGLTGGIVLSLATMVKLILTLIFGSLGEADWDEAAGFLATTFGMGFLCGIVVWRCKPLYRRFGMLGDAIAGLAVMLVFFIACMLVFDPQMLRARFSSSGAPMLGFAAVLGLLGGAWIGRDLRRTALQRKFTMKTPGPKDESCLIETPIESSQVFRGKLLDVRLDKVRLPDGNEATREYVKHPGAVIVIPVLDDGRLVFERQFRYPVGRVLTELPAGKIDPGEPAENAARRELLEETGFTAKTWRRLGSMHPCVGYSDEAIEIFLAQELEHSGGQNLDHEEFIDILELTREEAEAAIGNGEITDAKTIVALFWAKTVL
jgi:ADP-ribose pyrophosphatase